MSNASDLKAALVAEAADLDNTVDRLACLSDIDSWYSVRTALDTRRAADISGYTVAQRSIQRDQIANLEQQERQLFARINDYLYGRAAILVDNRTGGAPV